MPDWGKIARKVLNLPEPKPKQPQTEPAASGWADAAARLKEADAPGTSSAPSGQQMPWTVQEERSGARFARRFGRGLLWTVIGLAALTGVREWVYPNAQQAPPSQTSSAEDEPTFPTDDAQAVAARFARAYLSWDEDHPEQRAKLLAADLPEGADTAAGWDGNGKQDVLLVQPGEVTVTSKSTARVQVTALVTSALPTSDDKDDKDKTAAGQRWMGLEVPVTLVSGRVVVSGSPGLVGVPSSGPTVPVPRQPENDLELSTATRDVLARFFREYAAGDISSELAPGSDLPALPPGTVFESLQSWTADKGSGDQRHGTAVVVWQVAGGQLTQTYRVELTRVSAASGQRWQVADVLGGRA